VSTGEHDLSPISQSTPLRIGLVIPLLACLVGLSATAAVDHFRISGVEQRADKRDTKADAEDAARQEMLLRLQRVEDSQHRMERMLSRVLDVFPEDSKHKEHR